MKGYELVTEGHVDGKRFQEFGRLCVQHPADGTTVITGVLEDQAMLFAMLNKVRDLGLKLKSVRITEV